jgi:hypothetical protein
MSIADLRAQLEADRAWREEELRAVQNRGIDITADEERNRYRRVLVLLLYAHFEGFCKFALTLYASEVSRTGISCGDANYAIAAAALADLFKDLRNPDKKSDIFRGLLPDDAKLHRFARDREFVERAGDISKKAVIIPDHVVDTESNLSPVVLRKNLFRLGLAHDQFDARKDDINKLLGIRNGIAHGSLKDGVEAKTYDELRAATFSIMTELSAGVTKALTDGAYLR